MIRGRRVIKSPQKQKRYSDLEQVFSLEDMKNVASAMLPMAGSVWALSMLPRLIGREQGGDILRKALRQAFRGGVPGFAAAIVQIVTLMWLRTLMNYQIKTGVPMEKAFRDLYAQGGMSRFYKGLVPALALVPLSRFGDTAANAGVLTALKGSTVVPVALQTAAASGAAAAWRAVLMPLTVLKTNLQANGKQAMPQIRKQVKRDGVYSVFFKGTIATIVATWAGHYPWFATANQLEAMIPKSRKSVFMQLIRNALIGCIASIVSDLVSNSIRVVNAYRQVHDEDLSYTEAAKRIVKEGGLKALFFRGLSIKVIANCLNSIVFNVLVKMWMG
jgi:hypothetical protein